jgi:hypothetical protein
MNGYLDNRIIYGGTLPIDNCGVVLPDVHDTKSYGCLMGICEWCGKTQFGVYQNRDNARISESLDWSGDRGRSRDQGYSSVVHAPLYLAASKLSKCGSEHPTETGGFDTGDISFPTHTVFAYILTIINEADTTSTDVRNLRFIIPSTADTPNANVYTNICGLEDAKLVSLFVDVNGLLKSAETTAGSKYLIAGAADPTETEFAILLKMSDYFISFITDLRLGKVGSPSGGGSGRGLSARNAGDGPSFDTEMVHGFRTEHPERIWYHNTRNWLLSLIGMSYMSVADVDFRKMTSESLTKSLTTLLGNAAPADIAIGNVVSNRIRISQLAIYQRLSAGQPDRLKLDRVFGAQKIPNGGPSGWNWIDEHLPPTEPAGSSWLSGQLGQLLRRVINIPAVRFSGNEIISPIVGLKNQTFNATYGMWCTRRINPDTPLVLDVGLEHPMSEHNYFRAKMMKSSGASCAAGDKPGPIRVGQLGSKRQKYY